MACLACGESGTTPVARVAAAPVLCNVLCESREEALAVPRGEVRLEYCPACGVLSNGAFDPGLVRYHGAYENALHFSPHFRGYADALAAELVELHGLRGKRIAEIGCGDGSFLGALCRLGGNTGIGYDPAFDASRAGALPEGVRIVPRLFAPGAALESPDFLCCRHVLEHVARPREFLRQVRETIGERAGAAVYFEVPDAMWTLRERGIWDIIYEHCLYFTAPALSRLMGESGFPPVQARRVYGGQFLMVRARVGAATPHARPGPEEAEIAGLVAGFAKEYAAKVGEWRRRLAALGGRGAVVWGAGSKGVMFLNTLAGDAAAVGHVVDLNPRKHGKHVAGTGQTIVSPESLRDLRPDVVILMNPVYREEVAAQLAAMGLAPELLVA